MFTFSARKTSTQLTSRNFVRMLPVLFVIALLAVGCTAGKTPLQQPPGFAAVADVDLSARVHDQETLTQITLEQETNVGIFYLLENVNTPYFELSLVGPDGRSLVILRSMDYRTDSSGGGLWQHSLPPGVYRLLLSAPRSPGHLSVAWGNI